MSEVMWWVTVFVYWTTCALCIFSALKAPDKRWWRLLGIGFAVLAINKQHNLTGLITRMLRRNAFHNHWYFERADIQYWTIGFIGALLICLIALFWFVANKQKASGIQRFVLSILLILGCYSLMRSISLHALDYFLYRDFHGLQINWVFELGMLILAVAMVAGGIIRLLREQGQEGK
ncbi:MAG: hypothetical protein JXR76_29360 [Deltaproteobacteria bacterium]|nr:hypothetical protein [Deltaproteobacteria bacterium]